MLQITSTAAALLSAVRTRCGQAATGRLVLDLNGATVYIREDLDLAHTSIRNGTLVLQDGCAVSARRGGGV